MPQQTLSNPNNGSTGDRFDHEDETFMKSCWWDACAAGFQCIGSLTCKSCTHLGLQKVGRWGSFFQSSPSTRRCHLKSQWPTERGDWWGWWSPAAKRPPGGDRAWSGEVIQKVSTFTFQSWAIQPDTVVDASKEWKQSDTDLQNDENKKPCWNAWILYTSDKLFLKTVVLTQDSKFLNYLVFSSKVRKVIEEMLWEISFGGPFMLFCKVERKIMNQIWV